MVDLAHFRTSGLHYATPAPLNANRGRADEDRLTGDIISLARQVGRYV